MKATKGLHRRHEAYQHNAAPRLEGVVKNVGIKPRRKKKAERLALMRALFPEWLIKAQGAVRGFVLGLIAVASVVAPLSADAQTYYPSTFYGSYYQQQYPYYQNYQYPYYQNYQYPYYNNYYPYYGYYQQQPTCSITYQYINNAYWDAQGYHQPIQLSWAANNAYRAYISGIGSVSPVGQRVVYPSSGSTTYVLTATGQGGSATCQTTYTQPYSWQYQYQNYYYQYPYYQYYTYPSYQNYTYPYYYYSY
jgi:hypothetical protein